MDSDRIDRMYVYGMISRHHDKYIENVDFLDENKYLTCIDKILLFFSFITVIVIEVLILSLLSSSS